MIQHSELGDDWWRGRGLWAIDSINGNSWTDTADDNGGEPCGGTAAVWTLSTHIYI